MFLINFQHISLRLALKMISLEEFQNEFIVR